MLSIIVSPPHYDLGFILPESRKITSLLRDNAPKKT